MCVCVCVWERMITGIPPPTHTHTREVFQRGPSFARNVNVQTCGKENRDGPADTWSGEQHRQTDRRERRERERERERERMREREIRSSTREVDRHLRRARWVSPARWHRDLPVDPLCHTLMCFIVWRARASSPVRTSSAPPLHLGCSSARCHQRTNAAGWKHFPQTKQHDAASSGTYAYIIIQLFHNNARARPVLLTDRNSWTDVDLNLA